MRFVDEFRDAELGAAVARDLLSVVEPGRRYKLMEVCGGHTHSIYKFAIDDLLPAERRARPRPRVPGVRDPDGPRRRRDRGRRAARRDLHLLRRHAARARHGRHAARRQGPRRGRTDGLLAAGRAADRALEPRPRGRVPRNRLRDHGAVDGAHADAGQGRRRRELLLPVQPRSDRAAAACAAGLPRPAPGRLHRAGPRGDRGRRAAVRVHPRRVRQADRDRGLRAARPPASGADDPPAAARRPLQGREPVHAGRALRRQREGARGAGGGLRPARALRVARPRVHLPERAAALRRLPRARRRGPLRCPWRARRRPEGVPVRRGAQGRHQAVGVQGVRHRVHARARDRDVHGLARGRVRGLLQLRALRPGARGR